MSTWILVLTVLGTSGYGPAIHSISGFPNSEQCINAGIVWYKQLAEINKNTMVMAYPVITCMEQKK